MPPIRAASVRFIPSRTAASDNKPPALVRVLRRRGKPPKLTGREVRPHAHRLLAWRESSPHHGISSALVTEARESQPRAIGMSPPRDGLRRVQILIFRRAGIYDAQQVLTKH